MIMVILVCFGLSSLQIESLDLGLSLHRIDRRNDITIKYW